MKIRYITNLGKMDHLTTSEIEMLEPVSEKFAFRTNNYYNSLINWDDPEDPLRRLVVPVMEELSDWGQLDASEEKLYQPISGIEHKYSSTVLLLCNDVCAAYCRFCFRKRLFQVDNDEVVKDVSSGIQYIEAHPEVNNVLLTGGDPMVMSTLRLKDIIHELSRIEHVKNIRIGTKIPAFNPFRIVEDQALIEMFEYYGSIKQIYIMAHFNHPKELTETAILSLKMLIKAGVSVVNQTPIIHKVNDSSIILKELFEKLSFIGVQTYYVFACRPTEGNEAFAVPIEEAYEIYKKAVSDISGLAKTARFIMSHKQGKIEVLGLIKELIFFKNHNLVECSKNGDISTYKRNPKAYWLEDYDGLRVS